MKNAKDVESIDFRVRKTCPDCRSWNISNHFGMFKCHKCNWMIYYDEQTGKSKDYTGPIPWKSLYPFKRIITIKPSENIPDTFEKEIHSIAFGPVGELEPWGKMIVNAFLSSRGIKVLLGDLGIIKDKDDIPAYILKIEHTYLKYIDILPRTQQFMWIKDDEHSDSYHPDEALTILLGNGAKAIITDHGSSISVPTPNGTITIIDQRKR